MTFSRGCAKLMSLEREILGANIFIDSKFGKLS